MTAAQRHILAIDPGPERSAWIAYDPDRELIIDGRLDANVALLPLLRAIRHGTHIGRDPQPVQRLIASPVVIEKVEGFGMPVGAETFETVYWSGRFAEAAWPATVERLSRKAVKLHLCGSMRAKDPNVRQALIDRFGGSAAKGTKAAPGPLYGIAGDLWSALAVAVTWADRERGQA